MIKKIIGGLKNDVNSNGQYGLIKPDQEETIPFQTELQILYDNLENILGFNGPKVIVFASSTTGEGSSTIATYYSLLLAKGLNLSSQPINSKSGINLQKVLLIDANFRHPSVHQFFRLENDIGLSELILNESALERCIDYIDEANLSIIKTGKLIDNPFRLLNSQAIENVINSLKKHYSYIIIDSAPVLAHLDTLLITKYCDGIVLNIRTESTRREIAQKAKRKLIDANLKILGIILNRRGYYIPQIIYHHL